MPTATAPFGSPAAASLPKPSSLIDVAQSALADYAERPSDAEVWHALVGARRSAAAAIAGLSTAQKRGHDFTVALDLLQIFSASGAADYAATAEDLALARRYARHSWPGLLAAMLLVPAWQWPEAPRLDDVPTWLWPVYTAYLFYAPQGFCAPGQAETYATHCLRRLTELCRLAERNPGSAAVREAITLYQDNGSSLPLYFSADSLRRHYELRGRILSLASGAGRQEEPVMLPRMGRRLRLGLVTGDCSSADATGATLPAFEHLDPERFEVILFPLNSGDALLDSSLPSQAAEIRILPPGLEAQLWALREAALDVAVFGGNITAACNEITRLALFRIAPLQIVTDASYATSGLSEIDLYLSGVSTESADDSAQFSERLALLPDAVHAFDNAFDRQEPTTKWTRATLNLPEDGIILVSAANFRSITPEMQGAWARLLAAIPGSRLLVHPFNGGDSSDYVMKRFGADFDRVLAAHGVAEDRLLVSTMSFGSRADLRELLRVGDIYLDAFPFAGVNSLADSLRAGVPVLAWEGSAFRSRSSASLLRSLGLGELVARDSAAYHEIAVRLATDQDWRRPLRQRIQEKVSGTALFLDPLAASDAFGAVVERAYDELFQCGREAFRLERMPVAAESVVDPAAVMASAASLFGQGWYSEAADEARRILAVQPAHTGARHLMAAALLRQGRGDRAQAYLESAVNRTNGSAPLWHDLAVALHLNGRAEESRQALQTCLKLDASRLESWLMLHDWATEAGESELAAEAAGSAHALAAQDPRVIALTAETVAVR